MKVLHVVTLGPLDGRGIPGPLRVAMTLAHAAAEKGDTAEIWTTTTVEPSVRSQILDSQRVRIFPGRQWTRSSLASISSARLLWALGRECGRYDMVHLHLGRDLVMLPSAILLKIMRRSFVTQTHGMIEPGTSRARRIFDRLITRPLLSGAGAHFALQETEANWLITLGIPSQAIAIVPNAAAPRDPISAADRRDEVLFLAHLRPRKNVIMFYEAAKRLVKYHHSTRFLIVGPDGGDLQELQRLLAEFDGNGRIEYRGAVPAEQARALTAEASVYCLPAINEPFPISVLDAWSAGTPVIMTTGCHMKDIALSADAAVVVSPDAASISVGIDRLLRRPEERARYARNARALIDRELSENRIYDKVREAYRSAIRR